MNPGPRAERHAYIVRDAGELEWAHRRAPASSLFLGTTGEATELCRARGHEAVWLDEVCLREQHRRLNSWALERSLDLVAKFGKRSAEYLYFEANFLELQSLFVQPLKSLLVLDPIFRDNRIGRVSIHDDGRCLLAVALRAYAALFRPSLKVEVIEKTVSAAPAGFRVKSMRGLRDFFSRISGCRTRRLLEKARRKHRKIIFVSGGLGHLAPVLDRLAVDARYQILYAERIFNFQKFSYCLKKGIAFAVLPCRTGRSFVPAEPPAGYFQAGELVYDGVDYSEFFCRLFREGLPKSRFEIAYDVEPVEKLLTEGPVECLLLDEDLAARRIFYVLAERLGKRCYVVSHGVPGIPLLPERQAFLAGRYRSSVIFMHSEFERRMYERIYYDPARIFVSGLPRYDRMHRLRAQPARPAPEKRILYCGASMLSVDFEDPMPWLGTANVFRDYARFYTRDLLKIVSAEPKTRLWIKPHYDHEASWHRLIRECGPGSARYTLLSHRHDIFRLLSLCDVVVTAESTVIVEALIMNKPVILLNYTPYDLTVPFDELGGVEYARDGAALASALRRCLWDGEHAAHLARKRREDFPVYSAPLDGRCAERVAGMILKDAQKESHAPAGVTVHV